MDSGRQVQTAFALGATFAGILLKDSGRSAKGLVVRAQWAVNQWPEGWQNREVLGGALYRDGDYQGAVRELMLSHKLHGRSPLAPREDGKPLAEREGYNPSVFSCHFLALAHHKLGNADQARAWLSKAVLPKDANWENAMIDRHLRREVEAELNKKQREYFLEIHSMALPTIAPTAKALYLCDGSIGFPNQKSDLVGLFNSIRPARYPHVQQQFVVFAQLLGGLGQVPFYLDLRFAATDQLVHMVHTTSTQVLQFPNRKRLVQLAYTIQGCRFAQPGIYLVELCCDGQWVADTTLELLQEQIR